MIQKINPVIRFWPHVVDENTASFRMRCEFICRELRNHGINASFDLSPPEHCDILILSYRHDFASLSVASELRNKFKTKIILDIVDNHFVVKENITYNANNSASLIEALKQVDAVITSSEYLKNRLQEKLINRLTPIYIIDDIVEHITQPDLWDFCTNFNDFSSLMILNQKLKYFTSNKNSRIVWYGNHAGDYPDAGMSSLLLYRNFIEELARNHSLTLTVISNSRDKYKELIRPWKVTNFYLDWNKKTISKALLFHGIVVIPVSKNIYTLSKSANRLTKSLAHGLQVVADNIPSYSNYASYAFLDDPLEGLRACIEARGKNVCAFNYQEHNEFIIKMWQKTLESVITL